MLKKLAIGGMAAVIFFVTTGPVHASAPYPQLELHGRAAALIDGSTGQILYQQNGADTNFPASTTKLLTALVAIEHGNLDQTFKISTVAVDRKQDESSCFLYAGEEQKLRYLLYGLLLASGNDCAVAIAEGVSGGNTQQFVAWMNETAKKLGATHSKFANPHGLHDPSHYTTAVDLALIARGAFSNKTLLEIVGTKEFVWPGKVNAIGKPIGGPYYNHNEMLGYYPGTIGGKTGYTEEANLTLVSAAVQNGRTLIGVVMGEQAKQHEYGDMIALLDYGFKNFEEKPAILDRAAMGAIPVELGKQESLSLQTDTGFTVLVPKGSEPQVQVETKLDPSVKAPVQAGQKLGVVEIRDGTQLLGTVDVVAKESIEAKPQYAQVVGSWALDIAKWIVCLVAGILVFRVIVKLIRRTLRRSRRGAMQDRRDFRRRAVGEVSVYRTRDQTGPRR